MSHSIPLILVDALGISDVSLQQLADRFVGSLRPVLQAESVFVAHDSVVECSEQLSWVIQGLNDDAACTVGRNIVKYVILPYLAITFSATDNQTTPPSLKSVAKLFAELLCRSVIGVELVEDVLIPTVSALSVREPVRLQGKFEDTKPVQGEHLDPWVTLVLLQAVFRQRVTAQLETHARGKKVLAMLFSQCLQLFRTLSAVCCQLLASSVLPLFITHESAKESVEQLWKLVQSVHDGKTLIVCGKAELVQTILCCFSDLFIGRDKASPFAAGFKDTVFASPSPRTVPEKDIRCEETFLSIVQEGLVSSEPLERKRSRYLVCRMIASATDLEKLASQDWTFWWDKEHDVQLRAAWEDVILLLETLEEKLVHIVLPVLNRIKALSTAVNTKVNGHSLLHYSWLEVVLTRVINHESKTIIKWGVNEFLNMRTLSHLSSPKHWKFILGPLLHALSKSVVYERDASEHFSGCPAIVHSLSAFLDYFVGILSKVHQGHFIHQYICACWTLKLVDVPLVYASYGLSQISPMPILDSASLLALRSLVQGSLHTIMAALRGPIQNFLLNAVCSLTDMAVVCYADIFSTLGCFSNTECLVYGSPAWHQATSYLTEFCRTNMGAQSLYSYLCGAIQETLQDCPNTSAPTTGQVTLALLLALSSHDMYQQESILVPSGHTLEDVLAGVLGPVLDTIVSASNRPYLSHSIVAQAVEVMVGVLEMLLAGTKSGKVDILLYKYMLPWLPSLLSHCEHELLLGTKNGLQPDLDHTLLYKRALDRVYVFASNFSFPVNVNSLMNQAFEVLKGNGQPVELTAAFLGAVTTAAWATSHCTGSVGELFLNFPLTSTIKRPAISTSWEVQPDWSTLFHHTLTSYWQCVLYALQLRRDNPTLSYKDVPSINELAKACMDSVDLIGADLHVLISCLAIIAPELEPDILCSHVDQLWTLLMQYKTTPYFWAALSSFISLCFNISYEKLTAPSISAMQAKYIEELTELGQGKTRAYMLLVDHLCNTWLDLLRNNPDMLCPSLHRYTAVVIGACSFGPIYRKNLRLLEDTRLFVSTLGDECTANRSEHTTSNNYCVRVKMVSFLVHMASLADQPALRKYLTNLVVLMVEKLLQLSVENPKYYTNTSVHRQKLRLAQAMLVLIWWIDSPSSDHVIEVLLKCLHYDNQISVRYLLEWMTALLLCQHHHLLESMFYPLLQQDCQIRPSRLSSIFTIALHVSKNLPLMQYKIAFYDHVMFAVFLWCSNHNFTVRLYAYHLLILLWEDAQREVPDRFTVLGEVVRHMKCSSDYVKALHKLRNNVFFSHIDINEDLNIQTIYQILPQLTGVIEEEWLHLMKMFKEHDVWRRDVVPLSLESPNQALLECTRTAVHLDSVEESHQQTYDADEDDVQRKLSLLNGVRVMDELFPSLPLPPGQHRVKNGLIHVASLVQKIPNLGGLCRTCEVFGVSELIIDNLSILQDREFKSLSVTAEKWLTISEVKVHSIPKYLADKRLEGYIIAGLEQTAESCSIPEYHFKYKTVLVLGNEHYGIPVEVLHLIDHCLEAPQFGTIRSLNVHVAGAIAIWEYTKQHLLHH